MTERKKYTPQFKADAVELVITSGRPIAQCAVDLGINEGNRRFVRGKSERWSRVVGCATRYLLRSTACQLSPAARGPRGGFRTAMAYARCRRPGHRSSLNIISVPQR